MPLSPTTLTRVSTQWPHISYQEIQEFAEMACAEPDDFFDQGSLGICGPVSVLHALASRSQEGFLRLIDEVYRNPEKIPQNVREQKRSLVALLSTYLINQVNCLMTYTATTSAMDFVSGGITPDNIRHWMTQFFPQKKIQTYSSYFYGSWNNALEVNKLWENTFGNPIVIAFVNAAALQPESFVIAHKLPGFLVVPAAKGHFIEITTPFYENIQGNIEFKAFTWGDLN
ncbi:MAG: hypothetical protein WCK49_03505, partial [Myxococcaceae bacterium]